MFLDQTLSVKEQMSSDKEDTPLLQQKENQSNGEHIVPNTCI